MYKLNVPSCKRFTADWLWLLWRNPERVFLLLCLGSVTRCTYTLQLAEFRISARLEPWICIPTLQLLVWNRLGIDAAENEAHT
ncbi:hypothetical protein C8R47DRAFT_173787 [Mycena vitilis]|nr:hypothetical protein C8R47DRAFT_173787 [Mycena vitilis]